MLNYLRNDETDKKNTFRQPFSSDVWCWTLLATSFTSLINFKRNTICYIDCNWAENLMNKATRDTCTCAKQNEGVYSNKLGRRDSTNNQ